MDRVSRRSFILSVGALALAPQERIEPELILYNGNIWTVSDRIPRAQAVAISGGRFLAVGSSEEVLAMSTSRSRKIDLSKQTVLPGFIDAHSHPAAAGRSHLRQVDCDLRSIAEIQAALRERARQTPAGQWVLGFKYDDTKTSRSFLDAGIRPTQASDYPPGPFEPMMALQSEVTRTDLKGNLWGAQQRIKVEEAIRVGTINGAYASFEERFKGSIEPGKLADLVVLGRDPLREDPSSLITIPVERTMVGGRWVYES